MNGDSNDTGEAAGQPDGASEWEPPEGLIPAGVGSRDVPTIEEMSTQFSRYEIIDFLGSGGYCAVYRARQISFNRQVALKVLLNWDASGSSEASDVSEGSSAKRFEREAMAMAQLNHPHIVKVFEYGKTKAGLPFFSMECLLGGTIKDMVRSEHVDQNEVLEVVLQVCDALQYAHDKGIVHRDIKPGNILLDAEGRVKVTDFGLAKIIGTEGVLGSATMSSGAMGTLGYIAPEQCEAAPNVDHRADIYSLGVVLYELLTGSIPRGAFKAPSVMVPGVDARFDEIVVQAMLNEPDRRFQHISHMRTSLELVQNNAPEEPEPGFNFEAAPSMPPPETSDSRGPPDSGVAAKSKVSPALITTLSGLAVLMLGVFLFFFWKSRNDKAADEALLLADTEQVPLKGSELAPLSTENGSDADKGKGKVSRGATAFLSMGTPSEGRAEGELAAWLSTAGALSRDEDGNPVLDPVHYWYQRARAIYSNHPTDGPTRFAVLYVDGKTKFWGNGSGGQDYFNSIDGIVELALGTSHSLALDAKGRVFAWGEDDSEGRWEVPADLGEVTSIIAGDSYCAAVLEDGSVTVWGSDAFGLNEVPDQAREVISLRGGPWHIAALRRDGQVVCWGKNSSGECDVPPEVEAVKAIGCLEGGTVAMLEGDRAVAWGDPSVVAVVGEVAAKQAIADIKPGSLFRMKDGTWMQPYSEEEAVASSATDMGPIADLAVGRSHCFGILPDMAQPSLTKTQAGFVTGRFLRLETQDARLLLQLAEIEVVHSNRNLALGKEVAATGASGSGSLPNLTDGLIFSGPRPAESPNAVDGTVASIEIDLGREGPIGRVNLWPVLESNLESQASDGEILMTILDDDREITDSRPVTVTGGALVALIHHNSGAPPAGPLMPGLPATPLPKPHTDSQLTGDYFTGRNFKRPVASRQDSVIDFPWPTGIEPTPGLGLSGYSVRWRGMLTPKKSGDYTIFATADDGVRLWIDGKPIIEEWHDSVAREHRAQVALIEGKAVPLRMEFYQAGGDAMARLEWMGPDLDRELVPFSLLPRIGMNRSKVEGGEEEEPPRSRAITAVSLDGTSATIAGGSVLGRPPGGDDFVRIEANRCSIDGVDSGGHAVALRRDGSLVSWGEPAEATWIPPGIGEVIDFSVSPSASLALRADGTVIPFGRITGDTQSVPGDVEGATAVAAGEWHGMALVDGKVRTWGHNNLGQCDVPASLDSVTAITAGTAHSLALTDAGTVVAWGKNENGQCDTPEGLSQVVDIAATKHGSFALTGADTLVRWGANQSEPMTFQGIRKLGGANRNSVCVQKTDGTWWLIPEFGDEFRKIAVDKSILELTSVAGIALGLQQITEAHLRLSKLDEEFGRRWKEMVGKDFQPRRDALDANYRKALDRDLEAAIENTSLDAALAIRKEIERLERGEAFPETTPPGIPESLKQSMRIYAEARKKIDGEQALRANEVGQRYLAALGQLAAEFAGSPQDLAPVNDRREQLRQPGVWQQHLQNLMREPEAPVIAANIGTSPVEQAGEPRMAPKASRAEPGGAVPLREISSWMKEAALLVWTARYEEFEAYRRDKLRIAEGTEAGAVANGVAKLACLRPMEYGPMQPEVLNLAHRALELAGEKEPAFRVMLVGMAEYRNGRYSEAEDTLAALSTEFKMIRQPAAYYRVMSMIRQGKPDKREEARRLFDETEQDMLPLPAEEQIEDQNHDQLILWLAYKEAKALLEAPAAEEKMSTMEKSDTEWEQELAANPNDRALRQGWLDDMAKAERWDDMAKYYGGVIAALPDGRASHMKRFRKILEVIRRDDPVFEALKALRPQDSELTLAEARYHVIGSDWKLAAAVYPKRIDEQSYHDEFYECAAALLLAGDTEGYDSYMERLRELVLQSEPSAGLAYAVARAASVCPKETIPWMTVVEWAEFAANAEGMPWQTHEAGLAQLRAGNLDKALEWLNVSLSEERGWHPELNQVALSLVHARRADAEAARENLALARLWFEGRQVEQINGELRVQATDWLEFNLLFPEAVAAVERLK